MADAVSTCSNTSWKNRAELSIAHGALTNSKRPQSLVEDVYPTHLTRGHGAFVWDTDGKRYVDYICGLGTNLLGYGNEEVSQAINAAARNGLCLSLGSTLEVIAAEKVKECFPFIDQVRFLKTGTDACLAAVRIARAATNREWILTEGYHGWSDGFVSLTPPALGVHDSFRFEKFTDMTQINKDVAAVIVEPILLDASPARLHWLRQLREECTKYGVMLIFDEVITGFRYPKLGVSNCHGIEPDLVCLGKAIANGMPLAVVGGKREIMECGQYFVSSTYAGENATLSAAIKTMTLLQTKYPVENLWEKGRQFCERFNSIAPGLVSIQGYPTRGVFQGDLETKALFWQECCKAGIIFGPSWFFNFSHFDLSDAVLSTCRDVLTRIKTGSVKLEGRLPVSPYAQRVREGK
jgi:glutamate-1-semialdehyde 2,1-aminomutase